MKPKFRRVALIFTRAVALPGWLVFVLLTLYSQDVVVGQEVGPLVVIYNGRTPLGEKGNQMAGDRDVIRLEIHRADHRVAVCRGSLQIKTYPIAVGRSGWETPVGDFKILQLIRNPVWKHPLTGKIYLSDDPKNELGHYWIGFWTNGKVCVGFHGTPHSQTVGRSASHGCIRMYEKDIEELFGQVEIGTIVTVTP